VKTAEEIEREYGVDEHPVMWSRLGKAADLSGKATKINPNRLQALLAMRAELVRRDDEFDREVARRVKHIMQDRAEWGGFADNEAAEKLAIFANPTERWAFIEQAAWERLAAARTPEVVGEGE